MFAGRFRRLSSQGASRRSLLGVSALLFAAAAAATIKWCAAMQAMGGMPPPGGRMMSPVWAHMSGRSWFGAAAAFLGMWVVMAVAMMLPSLVPMLRRYREALGGTGETRLDSLTALAGAGYFCIWAVFGLIAFPLGVALTALELRRPELAHAAPIAAGAAIVMAGAFQFSRWKARRLACCRALSACGRALRAERGAAWRHGLRLGLRCCGCCANLMAILLVVGIMDLRAMAVVTAAITAERLAPAGARLARANGVIAVGAGLFLIARAAGLG